MHAMMPWCNWWKDCVYLWCQISISLMLLFWGEHWEPVSQVCTLIQQLWCWCGRKATPVPRGLDSWHKSSKAGIQQGSTWLCFGLRTIVFARSLLTAGSSPAYLHHHVLQDLRFSRILGHLTMMTCQILMTVCHSLIRTCPIQMMTCLLDHRHQGHPVNLMTICLHNRQTHSNSH